MHSRRLAFWLALGVTAALLPSRAASAWSIGSQLENKGCHERITAEALRRVRAALPTAPVVLPSRDEAALIDDVQFAPPADMVHDLAGMSLLLGVRDNDLKGNNPLDTLQLVEVHGNPATQEEHCIRSLTDDNSAGNQSALVSCRNYIRDTATEALQGLDAHGAADSTKRIPLTIYVSFAGKVSPMLPQFYVKIGEAMHALEDGFTHTYRTADGMHPTVVLNYIEYVSNGAADEGRDGPNHLASLDHCDNADATVQRNFALATDAATELLMVALDPARSPAEKIAGFDAVTAKYLTYQDNGCTAENQWCNAVEAKVVDTSGCNTTGQSGTPWTLIILIGGALALVTRRRASAIAGAMALLVATSLSTLARADDASPPPPVGETKPAVKIEPKTVDDAKHAAEGKEPGRDVATPTVAEVKKVREDKRLGNAFGFATSIGASVDHGAGAISVGGRYRINERWITGVDVQWNPWITSVPAMVKAGSFNAYATLIRRFPMRFDRVNLRTTLHAGVSTLLFDVQGAPMYSTGPYLAFTPLGIDYDLGKTVRIVIDPVEIALPMPSVGLIPLYYEQFRFMIGLQIGA